MFAGKFKNNLFFRFASNSKIKQKIIGVIKQINFKLIKNRDVSQKIDNEAKIPFAPSEKLTEL